MTNNNQFANYEETFFYKQKFQKLKDISSKLIKKLITEETYHKEVRETMLKDFKGNLYNGNIMNVSKTTTFRKNVNQETEKIDQNPIRISSKSPLKDFFDDQ